MNEQAKSKLHELADKCKHPDNYHQGPWMDYIQFAELIVRECAGVGSRAMYPDSDPDYVGREIRKHFGVEE